MSIPMPRELEWLAPLVVGERWPKSDETGLRALGELWDQAARQLMALASEIGPSVRGVLESVGGSVADGFATFTRRLRASLPEMSDAAGRLGQFGKHTALQIEYAKYMIIGMLSWTAFEIGQLAFWAPEAIPALISGARAIFMMIMKRLLVSIATGAAIGFGLDA
ncbi:hypothetical protein PV350_22730, partial [Streptomyces sp. PA03-6a]|nr:hypothetical protein [Streptomyces sp. PA03-6a]